MANNNAQTARESALVKPQDVDTILEGTTGFATRAALVYINRLLERTNPTSSFASRLCLSAEQNMEIPNFPAHPVAQPSKKKGETKKYRYEKKNGHYPKVDLEDWNALKEYFAKTLAATPEVPPDAIYENMGKLASYLKLEGVGREVLQLINVFETAGDYRDLVFSAVETMAQLPAVVSRLLGQEKDIAAISAVIAPTGPLMTYGLIYRGDDSILPETDVALWRVMAYPGMDERAIVKGLLGASCSTELTIDDFSHLGEDLQSMMRLLEAAVERGEKGVNIMLYGPPGSGKTELAKAIAAHLGKSLYAVGESEDFLPDGSPSDDNIVMDPPDRSDTKRMAQLQRAQALLAGDKDGILLFDEVEDLLIKGTDSTKKADVESKIGVNRMLEVNPVVTIWAGNDPEKFHEAVRQRFSYALYVGAQPTLVREKIWQRQLALQHVALPAQDVLELARKYDAPPRMVTKAVRVAALGGGGREAIERFMAADSSLTMGHREAAVNEIRIPEGYNVGLALPAAADQAKAAELIALSRDHTPFSLLVKGEQGAGSSYFLHYLGEQAVENVMEVSMADLAQPSPMMSAEQKVQYAFSAAANARAFLVVRDIEFLSDNPGSGHAHWDTSLADAFMNAARRHSMPFAVTADAQTELPLSVRNAFSHEIALKAFAEPQAREAYSLFFGHEAPAALDDVKGLVIEDFEAVRRRAQQYGASRAPDDAALIAMLQTQKKIRRDNESGSMIFSVPKP